MFDTRSRGYLSLKDVEDMLHSLCLSLSRSQVKHLFDVAAKSSPGSDLHYRALTDKDVDENDEQYDIISHVNPIFDINTDDLYPVSLGNGLQITSRSDIHDEESKYKPLLLAKEKSAIQYNSITQEIGKMTKKLSETQASELKLTEQVADLQAKCGVQEAKEIDAKKIYDVYLNLLTQTNEFSKSIADLVGAQFEEEKKEREKERQIKLEKEKAEKEAKEKERAERLAKEKEAKEAEKHAKEAENAENGDKVGKEITDDVEECPEEWEVVDAV